MFPDRWQEWLRERPKLAALIGIIAAIGSAGAAYDTLFRGHLGPDMMDWLKRAATMPNLGQWVGIAVMVVGLSVALFILAALRSKPSAAPSKFVDLFQRGRPVNNEDEVDAIRRQAALDMIEKDYVPIGVWGHLCHGEIKGKEFRDCHILGPAILSVSEAEPSTFYGCSLYASPDSILWPVPECESPPPAGAVRLYSCTFYRCTFDGVGFAVPEAMIKHMRDAEFTVFEDPPPTTA